MQPEAPPLGCSKILPDSPLSIQGKSPAIDCTRPAALGKEIAIQADIQVEEPIHLDEQRIFQVVANLLSNAVKFTPRGGNVSFRARIEGDRLVSEVSDDGIGIAQEDIGKLFNRFTQLDMGLTRTVGGTGLGLSIAKGIVEAHGGAIQASSPGLGQGATFRFEIPVTDPCSK